MGVSKKMLPARQVSIYVYGIYIVYLIFSECSVVLDLSGSGKWFIMLQVLISKKQFPPIHS